MFGTMGQIKPWPAMVVAGIDKRIIIVIVTIYLASILKIFLILEFGGRCPRVVEARLCSRSLVSASTQRQRVLGITLWFGSRPVTG